MSYFGAYFGGEVETVVEEPAAPEPISAAFSTAGLEVLDHVTAAIDRLCEYAKAKAT